MTYGTAMSSNNTHSITGLINTTNKESILANANGILDGTLSLTWDDILYDGGSATESTRSSLRWLSIIVSLIGIIGNVLAVCTLLRKRMRTLSTYTYLTALCVSNTITLTSVIIFELEIYFAPNQFNCILVSMAKAFTSSTFALSTWITVGFTVDRYIMICYPFTGEKLCTRRNAIFILILCLSLALAYLIPQVWMHSCHNIPILNPYNQSDYHILNDSSISSHYYPHSNRSELIPDGYSVSSLSDFGKSLEYRLVMRLFINCFLVRIIPFLVVLKLNLCLIRTLANTKRRHRQINPYERKRNDVTHMLVIVISIYLICIMPSIPFAVFFACDPKKYVDISTKYRIFRHFDDFSQMLTIFNSALQCYLYIFFGKRFRRELTHMICCFCVKFFYVPVPQSSSNSARETFLADYANNNQTYELVLSGKWSLDQRQDSIAGVEFIFHHRRRWSRLTSSSGTTTRSNSEYSSNRIYLNILKRCRGFIEQVFSHFK